MAGQPAQPAPRVLVVDDDRIMQPLIQAFLANAGVASDVVENAADAVAALNTGQYGAYFLDGKFPTSSEDPKATVAGSMAVLHHLHTTPALQHMPGVVYSSTVKNVQEALASLAAQGNMTGRFFPPPIIQKPHWKEVIAVITARIAEAQTPLAPVRPGGDAPGTAPPAPGGPNG